MAQIGHNISLSERARRIRRHALRMGEVHAPLLVIHGRDDHQIGLHHAQLLADASPGARLELIDGVNHWSVPTSPRYAEVIVAFLDGVFGGRG